MVGYTHVEVRKVITRRKMWSVTSYGKNGATQVKEVLAYTRLKRSAVLLGAGAAKALHVELRVTKRNGQYTKEASSFGHDPRDIPG